MKDVLDLYEEPYDAQYPTVYLDGLAHRYRKAVDLVEQSHFHIIWKLSQGKRVGEIALVTDYCPNWSENSGAPLQPAGATGTFRPAETEHRRSSAFFQRTKEAGTPNAIAASLLMVDCWGRYEDWLTSSPLDESVDKAKDPHSTRVGLPTSHLGFSLHIPLPRQIRNGKKHVSENCPSLVKHIQQAHPQAEVEL